MERFIVEYPFKRDSGYNVFGAEECIHGEACGISRIYVGILIDYYRILEYECGEWPEVDLFEFDFSVQLAGDDVHHFGCHKCLDLRELYGDDSREYYCSTRNK